MDHSPPDTHRLLNWSCGAALTELSKRLVQHVYEQSWSFMSAQQNKEDSRQLVYCVACSLMHAARACILSHISRHLYKLVYSLKRVHFLPGSTMMKMKTWLHTGHFAAFPSYAKLIHCKPRVWLSWPLNRWWCEQLYKMMFCFWIKLTDCQSQSVIWTSCYSCVFEMSFTEAALSFSQGMNAAWQTCQMVSYQNHSGWKSFKLSCFWTSFWLLDWKQQL